MESDGIAYFDVRLASGDGFLPGAALLTIGPGWLEVRGRHADAERLQRARLVTGLLAATAPFALVLALFTRGSAAIGLVAAAAVAGLGAAVFSRPFWIVVEESVARFAFEDLHRLSVSDGTRDWALLARPRARDAGGAPLPYLEFSAPDDQVGLDVYRLYLGSGDDMLDVSARILAGSQTGA